MYYTQFHWNPSWNFGQGMCRYTQNSSPLISSAQRNFHSLVAKCDYRNITDMAESLTKHDQ